MRSWMPPRATPAASTGGIATSPVRAICPTPAPATQHSPSPTLLRRRPSATVVNVTLGHSCSRLRSVLPHRVSVQGPKLLPRRGRGSFPAMPSVALSFRVETLSLFVSGAHCPSGFSMVSSFGSSSGRSRRDLVVAPVFCLL